MTDHPKYAFIKLGKGILKAEMEMDEESLDGVAYGERVQVEIKQFRNADRLKAWWALLYDCKKACGLDEWTLEALGQHVRLETGYFDEYGLPDGGFYRTPKSVAFLSKLKEAEMVQLFRATEKYLAETWGYVKEREYA